MRRTTPRLNHLAFKPKPVTWKGRPSEGRTLIKHFKPTPSPIAATHSPLRAYRSLLRALSYFPDQYARDILRRDARERFEKHKVEKKARLSHRLQKAYQVIHCVERANLGNREDLETVLHNAYGKRGRRRRVLLSQLLKPGEDDLPQDNNALQALMDDTLGEKRPSSLALQLTPPAKCKAMIASFQREIPIEFQRGKRRPPSPVLKMPKNLWGREMPLKRQANIKREWWALTLEKLYPPLPEHEWDRLRDLTTGKIRLEPLARRLRPENVGLFGPEGDHMVVKHLLNPARANGNLKFDESRGLFVDTRGGREPFTPGPNYQRSMRRLYGTIWQISAKMHQDPTSKEWNVEWGDKMTITNYGEFPLPTLEAERVMGEIGWEGPPEEGPAPKQKPRKKRDATNLDENTARNDKRLSSNENTASIDERLPIVSEAELRSHTTTPQE
jgi:hypothetical protein